MNPDKQRIAIAESCGWEYRLSSKGNRGAWFLKDTRQSEWILTRESQILFPDYLNDLDAIRQAVMELPRNKRSEMCAALGYQCANTGEIFVELTAADWCKAYLVAIGKWEED